jgi:hypothetical protein
VAAAARARAGTLETLGMDDEQASRVTPPSLPQLVRSDSEIGDRAS